MTYLTKILNCIHGGISKGASPHSSTVHAQAWQMQMCPSLSLVIRLPILKAPFIRTLSSISHGVAVFDSTFLCDTTDIVEVAVRPITLPGAFHSLHHKQYPWSLAGHQKSRHNPRTRSSRQCAHRAGVSASEHKANKPLINSARGSINKARSHYKKINAVPKIALDHDGT